MTRKQPVSNKSNAANGTKQIWVKKSLHRALAAKAREDDRTIRITVERMLLAQLGFETIEDLEESFPKAEAA